MTSDIREPTLELEARRQFGAFHVDQARAHGWSRSRLYRARRAGIVRPALPDVCTFTSAPSTRLQRYMVALLWAGPESALGKRSAAELHRLDAHNDGRIHIVSPRHLRSPNGQIRVYRRMPLPPDHIVASGALRITSIERTLFELAWDMSNELLDSAIDDVISRGLKTLGDLWSFWIEFHACGRNGSVKFRERLERRAPNKRPPSNRNERRFLELCRSAGLPTPLCQVPLYSGARFVARPDFLFPQHRLVVEAQSRRFHGTIAQRIADDARAALLDALGWRVIRVWWEEMEEDPEAVIARIRRSLAASAA